MNVIKAVKGDLIDVANVHKKCFDDSFSTQLGTHLLSKFYYTYLEQNPNLFYVAKDSNGAVIGFCMGYMSCDENLTKKFIKKNLFWFLGRCLYLALILNKQIWRKFFHIFKKSDKKNIILNEELAKMDEKITADLLSICVLPEYRGKGVSSALIKKYESELLSKNVKYCVLSVEPNNIKAIRFYDKNGFTICKKSRSSLVYKKRLME